MAGRTAAGVQYCDMMSSLDRNNNISMHDMMVFKSNILKVSPLSITALRSTSYVCWVICVFKVWANNSLLYEDLLFYFFFGELIVFFCSLFCLKKLHLKTNHTFLTQWPINKFTHNKIFSQYLSYYFTWWSKRVCLEK